jgi:hypothetical protein
MDHSLRGFSMAEHPNVKNKYFNNFLTNEREI